MSSQPKGQAQRKGQQPQQAAAGAGARGRAAQGRGAARAASAQVQLDVTPELVNRAKREVARMKYVTPFRLAQALSVNMALARKLLRRLVAEGSVEQVAKNRRIIVAVPKSQQAGS